MGGKPDPEFEDFFVNKEGVEHVSNYNFQNRYGQSKLANIYFTKGLGKQVDEQNAKGKNLKLKTVSLHPGVIATDLTRGWENSDFQKRLIVNLFSIFGFMFAKTRQLYTAPSVHLISFSTVSSTLTVRSNRLARNPRIQSTPNRHGI